MSDHNGCHSAAELLHGARVHKMTPSETTARPAFYALVQGGWRDYVTLLHLPYTAWHLSYVTIGAALATTFNAGRFAATLLAFFLAVGIGAHALDELTGRPLRSTIPARTLIALAVTSLAGAIAVGVSAAIYISPWIAVFVAVGALILVAYNLELWNGVFHTDTWFALAWGGFPIMVAYFAQAQTIDFVAITAAAFATTLAFAQRQLSTAVRNTRRRVRRVHGEIEHTSGEMESITVTTLIGPAERALQLLTIATVVLSVALLLARAT